MRNKAATLGVRLSLEASRAIKQISASQGRTPSALLGEYAEEIARGQKFCHLEFRSTPLGRMAYIEGTRTAVWLITDLVRQEGGDVKAVAKSRQWPETKVRAALNYAAAYPEEIESLIERAHSISEDEIRRLNAA
jgi:uncharacterized protein (DUF433 family)